MSGKAFASQADLEEKQVTFDELGGGLYAYTAEGDPNTGIIVGDDSVMVVDTQATPVMAKGVIERIREVTDKPIEYVVLSHYHAVRVLGASAYGAKHIIASRDTLEPDFGKWVIFEHCMPFDVTRAYDEASGIEDPRIWTAERDRDMWQALEQDLD